MTDNKALCSEIAALRAALEDCGRRFYQLETWLTNEWWRKPGDGIPPLDLQEAATYADEGNQLVWAVLDKRLSPTLD
jgi:hypothetical protein